MGRLIFFLLLTLLAHIFTTTVVKSSSDEKLPWPPVKYTKLHFFLHAKLSPPNETQVVVVKPASKDLPFNFGEVDVFDEPLTTGPSTSSPKLGRCQGMYMMSDQNARAGLASMSLTFSDGSYNGSTIVLLGRYNFELIGDDLPIVGGLGHFSYAQGVCKIKNFIDPPEAVYVVDCDVYHRSPVTSNI